MPSISGRRSLPTFAQRAELCLLLLLSAASSVPYARNTPLAFSAAVVAAIAACRSLYRVRGAPSHYSLVVREAVDSVGVSVAALLPLALAALQGQALFNGVRTAAVAVALADGFSVGPVALVAAGVAMARGSDAAVVSAAVMPGVMHALLMAAPRVFAMGEAAVVASLAVDCVLEPALYWRGGGKGEREMGERAAVRLMLCALVAAVLVALFVLPVAIIASGKRVWKDVGVRLGLVVSVTYMYAWRIVLGEEPVAAVLRFVFGTPLRLGLLGYWAVLLAGSLVLFVPHRLMARRILARKVYHILALALFLPSIFFEPEFTGFALSVAFVLMLLVEVLRVGELGAVGLWVDKAIKPVIDERDDGAVVVTHMYLLLGIALPLWFTMADGGNLRGVLACSGIICLGVQDAVASAYGSTFGRTPWPSVRKTVEGTVAGIVVTYAFAFWWAYVGLGATTGVPVIGLLLATTAAGLFEAFTVQIDNLVLPLFYYCALKVCRVT